jgi:hypothetical protein
MKYLFRTGIAVLALTSAAAFAQTDAPTPLAPPVPPAPLTPPPGGTLATVRTDRAVDANGNMIVQKQSTYRDPNGVAQDSTTTQVTRAPAPPPVTTTTTSTYSSTTNAPPQ